MLVSATFHTLPNSLVACEKPAAFGFPEGTRMFMSDRPLAVDLKTPLPDLIRMCAPRTEPRADAFRVRDDSSALNVPPAIYPVLFVPKGKWLKPIHPILPESARGSFRAIHMRGLLALAAFLGALTNRSVALPLRIISTHCHSLRETNPKKCCDDVYCSLLCAGGGIAIKAISSSHEYANTQPGDTMVAYIGTRPVHSV